MKALSYILLFGLVVGAVFLVSDSRTVPIETNFSGQAIDAFGDDPRNEELEVKESADSQENPVRTSQDLPPQEQLANPPEVVKAIYLTGWTAGNAGRMQEILALIDRTEINAVVVDIKDFSGNLSYYTDVPLAKEINAYREIKILRPNAFIKQLHDRGVYVIARQTVMQDPILAEAYPEWALQDATTDGIWRDNKGLGWMDPAAKEAWDYNVAIANDALGRGFDEVNFDYIRFASDGKLSNIEFPIWEENELKTTAIARFFKYLRENVDGTISADLFGLTTANYDGLGIGQLIEDAYKYFDYICPMVYPSHYASGFIGLSNPGAHPVEVVEYSMERARERLEALAVKLSGGTATSTNGQPYSPGGAHELGKLRPWLQDFSLGVDYGAEEVRGQIDATDRALRAPDGEHYAGWLLWDPSNRYTESALRTGSVSN